MKAKRQLAARLLKTSLQRVRFKVDALDDIKKAITRSDIRGLVAVKKIIKAPTQEQSRGRARDLAAQKRKGRRRGQGSKKGKKYSRVSRKEQWMIKIRAQRVFLREIKQKALVAPKDYRNLYAKSKGGFFRNTRHIKLYMNERKLFVPKEVAQKQEK